MTIRPASEWRTGEPGWFADVPEDEYHDGPEASASRLGQMASGRTPAHLYAAMTAPSDTASQSLGRAAHAAVLQPMHFLARYDRVPGCEAETKAGAPCSASGKTRHAGHWFCGRHTPDVPQDDVLPLSDDDYELVTTIARNVRAAKAADVLNLPGGFEVSARWQDPLTGVMCRCRFDFISPDRGVAADLKTTRDASDHAWARSVAQYGYHRQQAFYERGAAALGVKITDFRFILAENSLPALVRVVALPDSDVALGGLEIDDLLRDWETCVRLDRWPGYDTTTVRVCGLPPWYYTRMELSEEG